MSVFVTDLDYDSAVPHKLLKFSGGEVQVRLERSPQGRSFEIQAHLGSSDAIMETLLLTDALRRNVGGKIHIDLVAPYFPYARQDRCCEKGEAIAVRVMADIINSQNYSNVVIWDAHSDVVPALLNNCINRHCGEFVRNCASGKTVLVAPDAGAAKKVREVAARYVMGVPNVVEATKHRSTIDGSISDTTVKCDHIGNRDFLIVDDICDGGRTFTELAAKLKPLTDGKIYLYVTHGIFSRGFEPFHGLIDRIYCPNPFPEKINPPFLTII